MPRYPLWEDGIPNELPGCDQTPWIEPYLLKGSDNPCVVVLPGGAYAFVSLQNEGVDICEMLNRGGYSAVMVNYRIAPYTNPAMVDDAKRAVRMVRYRAKEFGIDPEKIGVIGFSAGGHLCCMTALLADDGLPEGDAIDRVSSRVNTAAPCYAVSSLDSAITHADTRKNFLGALNNDRTAYAFSAENMITPETPPFFLWHTASDGAVPVACSLRLAEALIAHGISTALHVFPAGDHGLGVAAGQPLAKDWPQLYLEWLDYYNK